MKRRWECLFISSALVLLAGCSGLKAMAKKPVVSKKEAYYCSFTTDPIKVDGVLDDPAWEKAKSIELNNLMWPDTYQEPISKTEARLLYDDNYLYVCFKAYDQDIYSLYSERDSDTCLDDVLEIFLKTSPDKYPYYNFEINALSTVLDGFCPKRGSDGGYRRWRSWNCKGIKIATGMKGTLNNWEDKDEYWILEVAIPFAELPTVSGQTPKKGDTWLFNLTRYDYSVYLPEGRELMSYAPLSVCDFHHYEDFSKLIFQ